MDSKIKVTFENNGCGAITIFGRPRIEIPGSGTVDAIFPDGSRTTALLERLRREYPSLIITKEQVSAVAPAAAQGGATATSSATKASAPEKTTEKTTGSKDKSAQATA